MAVIRDIIIKQSQSKDGFIWGIQSGSHPGDNEFADAAKEANVFPMQGFASFIVGRKHTKFKATSPPENWERLRGYLSFYTSGFRDGPHVESVTLRFFVKDGRGMRSNTVTPFTEESKNWNMTVWTVSGGNPALQRTYVPGNDPVNYGFGDALGYYDDGEEDYLPFYEVWGRQDNPVGSSEHILEEYIASGVFYDLVDKFVSNPFRDSEGNPIRFTNKWLEIPLPIDKMNNEGETHLRLTHHGEMLGELTEDGGGFWNDHNYFTIESSEGSREPELKITTLTLSEPLLGTLDVLHSTLREVDLSIQRHLQHGINLNTTFSGLSVIDAFPENFTNFHGNRLVSLEHVSSITGNIEVGSRRTIDNRRFFIDIVCNRRGECLDLSEVLRNLLNESVPVKDFRYDFINPPDVGRVYFDNIRVYDVETIVTIDRYLYHKIISVDGLTLSSGV
jgi:hypothetical protein